MVFVRKTEDGDPEGTGGSYPLLLALLFRCSDEVRLYLDQAIAVSPSHRGCSPHKCLLCMVIAQLHQKQMIVDSWGY